MDDENITNTYLGIAKKRSAGNDGKWFLAAYDIYLNTCVYVYVYLYRNCQVRHKMGGRGAIRVMDAHRYRTSGVEHYIDK